MKKLLIAAVVALTACLTAFAQPTASLNFTWNQNTETDLAGYYFYTEESDGSASGEFTLVDKVKLPSVPRHTRTGLRLDRTYRFSVTAFNAMFESDKSNYVIVNTTIPDATAPEDLKIVLANNNATISWKPNPAAEQISKYEISVAKLPSGPEVKVATAETSVVVPVEFGSYYIVTVTAVGPSSLAFARTMILGKIGTPTRLVFEGKITVETEQ